MALVISSKVHRNFRTNRNMTALGQISVVYCFRTGYGLGSGRKRADFRSGRSDISGQTPELVTVCLVASEAFTSGRERK